MWHFLSSAVNLWKQFAARSDLIAHQAWSGPKLFETLMVFLKDFWKKMILKKNQQTTFVEMFIPGVQYWQDQWHLLSSAVNLCKQFGTRSGLMECQAWSGSKLFDTLMTFLKEFLKKSWFWKYQQTTSVEMNISGVQYIQDQWHILSSLVNLCKQFGARSGLTNCQAWSGPKLFHTDGTSERIFDKVDFEKNSRQQS